MASPKYIAEAKKFQRIFSSYFPQFSDFETAAFELEWIKCRVFGNPIETVRRRKARSELKKVINALRLFSTHDTPYWQGFWELRLDAAKTAEVGAYQREILDFLLLMGEMNDKGLTEEVLGKFAERANQEISRLPEKLNINWESAHSVAGFRVLWWRNTGKDAPSRALNPASEFCSYLHDGFAFFDISADPVSAFKRWAARYPRSIVPSVAAPLLSDYAHAPIHHLPIIAKAISEGGLGCYAEFSGCPRSQRPRGKAAQQSTSAYPKASFPSP